MQHITFETVTNILDYERFLLLVPLMEYSVVCDPVVPEKNDKKRKKYKGTYLANSNKRGYGNKRNHSLLQQCKF